MSPQLKSISKAGERLQGSVNTLVKLFLGTKKLHKFLLKHIQLNVN